MSYFKNKLINIIVLISYLFLFILFNPNGGYPINSEDIEDGSITTIDIADGTIQTNDIHDDSITSRKIKSNSVGSSEIRNRSIDGRDIKLNTIDGKNIEDHSLSGIHLKKKTINGGHLIDDTIRSKKIKDGTIQGVDIKDGSIPLSKLSEAFDVDIADNSVTTSKILDGTILNEDLANNSISSSKLQDEIIGESKLSDNAVTTDKVADNAITALKIADNSISKNQILDGTIETSDIADNSISNSKIQNNAVTNSKVMNGAITNLKIQAGTIQSDRLAFSIPSADLYTANYIVDSLGNGDFTTIQAALDAVSTIVGGNVYVRNGIYNEEITIDKNNVKIVGANASTTINGQISISNCVGINIAAFNIVATGSSGTGIAFDTVGNASVYDCSITGDITPVIGIDLWNSNNIRIKDNNIYTSMSNMGIHVSFNNQHIKIAENVITHNDAIGIQLSGTGSSYTSITNNDFIGSGLGVVTGYTNQSGGHGHTIISGNSFSGTDFVSNYAIQFGDNSRYCYMSSNIFDVMTDISTTPKTHRYVIESAGNSTQYVAGANMNQGNGQQDFI